MPWFPEGNNKKAKDDFRASVDKVFPHSVEFAYFPLADLMIGDGEFDWRLSLPDDLPRDFRIGIRVPTPMAGGFPLRFGNEEQVLDGARWMVVDFGSQ